MISKYKIEMELLTETIFGSGHSIPGTVDLEIVYDNYGFPFMKAKTFKGNLRKVMENSAKILEEAISEEGYVYIIKSLLGDENNGVLSWRNLKFSDCRINEKVRNILEQSINKKRIIPEEIKNSLTDIRMFNSLEEDGSSRKGSLRKVRVIKKGLKFYVDIDCERELEEKELGLLAVSVRMLRHVGTMRTRGKGEVECKFLILENGEYVDKTDYYIDFVMKGVSKGV